MREKQLQRCSMAIACGSSFEVRRVWWRHACFEAVPPPIKPFARVLEISLFAKFGGGRAGWSGEGFLRLELAGEAVSRISTQNKLQNLREKQFSRNPTAIDCGSSSCGAALQDFDG